MERRKRLGISVYGNAGGFYGGGQRLPELRYRKRHRAVSGQIQASVNHWAAGNYPAQPTLPGTGSPSARPRIIFTIRGTVAAPQKALRSSPPTLDAPRRYLASCAPFWAFVGIICRRIGK